jgi:hypothetical protein
MQLPGKVVGPAKNLAVVQNFSQLIFLSSNSFFPEEGFLLSKCQENAPDPVPHTAQHWL